MDSNKHIIEEIVRQVGYLTEPPVVFSENEQSYPQDFMDVYGGAETV